MNTQYALEKMADFLVYKHSLGYVYGEGEKYLKRYFSFVNDHGFTESMTKESINKYLETIADANGSLYGTVCALRGFAQYLIKRGESAYLIPEKTVGLNTPHPPYFFTDDEVSAFFVRVDSIEPANYFRGRDLIIPALFRILYCCGLRCKEVRMLRCENVCLEEGYLDVIQSKGPKSRRIFISEELKDYLMKYEEKISRMYPDREYFFPGYSRDNRPYLSEGFICKNFHRYWEQAFPDFNSKISPRAYDFRHHFAYANINRWAEEGLDVNAMLPYLMRYMGHQNIKETMYYFHFVPDFYPTYEGLARSTDYIFPEVPE